MALYLFHKVTRAVLWLLLPGTEVSINDGDALLPVSKSQ